MYHSGYFPVQRSFKDNSHVFRIEDIEGITNWISKWYLHWNLAMASCWKPGYGGFGGIDFQLFFSIHKDLGDPPIIQVKRCQPLMKI